MTHPYLVSNTPSLSIQAEEGTIAIPFSAVAAYHGHGALAMLAIIYQGLRGALPLLEENGQAIPRQELTVISGHPGPGVRDAFECVTRAVTRGCYTVDLSLPLSRISPKADKGYGFLLRRGNRQVQAALREDILPQRFFDLFGNSAPEALREHAALRHTIAQQVLAQSPDQVFVFTLQDC